MAALRANPLSEDELRARAPKVPDLRLKPDRELAVTDRTPVATVFEHLDNGVRSLRVRLDIGGRAVDAVLVPVDHYVRLVGENLARNPHKIATLNGGLLPSGLASADVEPVDPQASWNR